MKRGRNIWWLVIAILSLALTPVAPAGAMIASGPTTLLPRSPLLVTAYQTNSSGTDLDFVEIYNDGDSLVHVQNWGIADVANSRVLQVSTSFHGDLEPGHHVVMARDGIVTGATTFHIDGWDSTPTTIVPMTSLRLEASGYRSLDAKLSTKAADLDQSMIRTYNTSSYSTATSPFEEAYRSLFDDGLYAPPMPPTLRIVEVYPYASDCAPNDTSVLCGDYVKLVNTGNGDIDLDGLVLRTSSGSSESTSANTFALGGTLAAGDYMTVWQTDSGAHISLTNSGGYLWLEDTWHLSRYDDTMTQYVGANSSQQGLAYALDNTGVWQWTSTPSPDQPNVITPPVVVLAPCPEGKYRNPDTNRCRNIEDVISELAACDEGYERNPATNRCRKIASASSTLTPCREGQVRNPETNRCRSIASEVADLIPCNDGYERNPATNRCRKVQGGEVKGAEYPVEPITSVTGNTAGLWTLGGVVVLALAYAGWEWRGEVVSLWQKLFHRGE